MPNPKRRHSQKRTSTRRAHDALKAHSLVGVPQLSREKDAAPRLPANAVTIRDAKFSTSKKPASSRHHA